LRGVCLAVWYVQSFQYLLACPDQFLGNLAHLTFFLVLLCTDKMVVCKVPRGAGVLLTGTITAADGDMAEVTMFFSYNR
jgi:hypothetical protein